MTEETHRTCSKCSVEKPIQAFKMHYKKSFRRRSCQECDRVIFRERHREWRDKNRPHIREYARVNMRRRIKEMDPETKKVFDANMARKAVDRREKLKAAVYMGYGGARCACCAEDEPFFLSIDHVNNDGYEKRKSGDHPRGTENFYKMILRMGCPPDFQILCMNCNHGKSRNKGICPHQLEKVQRLERKLVGSSDPKPPALFCEEMMI